MEIKALDYPTHEDPMPEFRSRFREDRLMPAKMELYEQDFYHWTQDQTTALRTKAWDALDVEHLAEEIESLGNEQRHAVRSHLRILVMHLLKWTYQPGHRSESWRGSISNARAEIEERLEDSPSLTPLLPELLTWVYPRARRRAAQETGLLLATFPDQCPWALAQILHEEFWPEGAA